MTLTVWGLKNCDTCRKALKALEAAGREHVFRDVRADGASRQQIARWAQAVGWETLLNRRGTTWRSLPEADKQDIDEGKAVALMAAHPALIKRPVFEDGTRVIVGFDPAAQQALDLA